MRSVLISFKDNAAAEAFVRSVIEIQGTEQLAGWGDRAGALGILTAAHAQVDAVMARPTTWCKCAESKIRGGQGGWNKTEGFGWFVCHLQQDLFPASKALR